MYNKNNNNNNQRDAESSWCAVHVFERLYNNNSNSSDGRTAAAAAAATWFETAHIFGSYGASGDRFGRTVSIHENTLFVGAEGDDDFGSSSGTAYICEQNPGTRVLFQVAKIGAQDATKGDEFGSRVAKDVHWIVVGDAATAQEKVFVRGGCGKPRNI
jgi:hypothetical protein